MNTINVSRLNDGNWQVGNETLTPQQFQSRLDHLAASNSKGLFRIDGNLTVDASTLSRQLGGGTPVLGTPTLHPPTSSSTRPLDTSKLSNLSAVMAEVFKLITSTSMVNRESARESRQANQVAEQKDLARQVELLKEAGEKAFQSAIVNAAISIGVSIGSAVLNGVSAGKALKELKGLYGDFSSNRIETEAFQNLTTQISTESQIFSSINDGVSKSISGASDITKGSLDRDAEVNRSLATQSEANSRLDAAAIQEETEFLNHFQELLRDFIQKMAAINESTEQSLASIMRA